MSKDLIPKDLTFESVCKIVKDGYPELGPDIDAFLNIALAAGVTTLAVPIATASGATALTPALIILTAIGTLSNCFGVKNEIFNVGKHIISKITSKREYDVHEHYAQMQHAYTLICYTAFFETLAYDKQLAPLFKKIKMKPQEKISIVIAASKDLWGLPPIITNNNDVAQSELAMFKYEIAMPQPGDTFEAQRRHLAPLYEQLAKRIIVFFELETIKAHISSEQDKIIQAITGLPKKALDTFVEQYNMLAMKFPEFALWLNLQKDDKIIQLTEQSRQLLESISQVEQRQTTEVLRLLANHYHDIIDTRIIEDPDSGLIYPRKRDIFILQSFKITHYKGPEQLKESFWDSLPVRHDLEVFLHAYLNHDERSTRTPLIILGQPGSGKSLLTSMIAARLVSLPFTPIRIELRYTNAEDPISAQIEGQIRRDTDTNFDWTTLRDHTVNGPALVLFDGYDELLQATGKVFSGYLNQVKEFQTHQLALSGGHQSVRAVVTSRFTLIDKAVIPPGSTIIRLLEFDGERQTQWINKWNAINAPYFQQSHTDPFKLPQDYNNIKRLAEQPLLLMMLAIYDAKGNPLSKAASDLDQSLLYDRLLRRFIERELQKDKKSAQSWQEYELNNLIDHEMERLGVAAMGMFNRRTVSIKAEELDADLKFFDLEESSLESAGYEHHTVAGQMGRQLLPSEKLFGSFFFQKLEAVHKTEEIIKDRDRNVPARLDDTAYEFLHNTFGEFLTADFMLRGIFEKTGAIRDQANKRSARNRRFSRSTASKIDLTTFDKMWYARFIYAPLFSRPVVLRLLREWSRHCLQKEERDVREFLEDFDTIITNHINILLSNNDLPSLMTSDQRPFAPFSAIGYIAIYTLNVLLLRTFLAGDYTFDEANYTYSEDGTRAWDRLTYLWRSWFSLETLKELAGVLKTERNDTKLKLFIRKEPDRLASRDRLNLVHIVSQTLADNITSGLSGLLLHDTFVDDKTELDNVIKQLQSEQIDSNLRSYLFKKQLQYFQREKNITSRDAERIFNEHSKYVWQYNRESAASLYIEIANVLLFLKNELDINIKLDASKYIEAPPYLEGLEAFHLLEASLSRDPSRGREIIERWFIEGGWIGESKEKKKLDDIFKTNRNLILSEHLIAFMEKNGYWSLPEYISLESLQKLVYSKKVLPMKLAKSIIKLAREVGDRDIMNFIYQYYLKDMNLHEIPMSIDLATELVKLARERGDYYALSYFMDVLLKKLREDRSVNRELTVEVISFAREAGNQRALTQFLKEYLTYLVAPFEDGTRLMALEYKTKHIPTIFIIELLKLAIEIDDQQINELLMSYIQQILDKTTYIQPNLALEILRFTRKVKDQVILEDFKSQYIDSMLQTLNLISVELTVELIKSVRGSKRYSRASIANFYHKNITPERCHLDILSVDTIVDLRELAHLFGDDMLLQKINKRLKL